MSMLLAIIAVLIGIIVIQAAITMLAAWGITGRRPPLGSAIKALLLSGIAYIITAVLMAFQTTQLQSLGLPMPLVLAIVIMMPLLISCWVFAGCLNINLLQAFAINLLIAAIYMGLAFFSAPYVPAMQDGLPKTQFTQIIPDAITELSHA